MSRNTFPFSCSTTSPGYKPIRLIDTISEVNDILYLHLLHFYIIQATQLLLHLQAFERITPYYG